MTTTAGPETPPGHPGGRPPEPADYGTINAVYGLLLGALVAATHQGPGRSDPIAGPELLPMGAATFALAKVIAKERIGAWVREPFVEELPDGEGPKPAGTRLRRAVGELVTCTRCVGAWSALGIVAVRMASPPAGRVVTAVLATSAVNDFLQAGFSWMASRTDIAGAEASTAGG